MNNSERHGRHFGTATLVGDHADEYGFFNQSKRDQALDMGWSHACVIALQLTDPANPDYGPDKMLKRYGETNFWFGYFISQAAEINPSLSFDMKSSVLRLPYEPVGVHETQSIPDEHVTQLAPMARIYGYAIPRVLIEAMGRDKQRSPDRALNAIRALDEVIKVSETPAELLALLSEKAIAFGADAKKILGHVLPAGVLQEENCFYDYGETAQELEANAPNVWAVYLSMSRYERSAAGIATI